MKNIKLLLLLLCQGLVASVQRAQESEHLLENERQRIIEVVESYSGLQDGFSFLQSQGLAEQSFQDFLQQNIPEIQEDEELNLDLIVNKAENVLAEYLKDNFLSTLKTAMKERKTVDSFKNDPLFAYVMKHKNDYMHDMTTFWLYEWSQTQSNNQSPPLVIAADSNNKEVAELLIAAKADVNIKDINRFIPYNFGMNPLHWVAQNNSKQVAELLIAGGADVNIQNNDDMTPLMVAAEYNSKEIVKLLIAARAHLNIEDSTVYRTPLHWVTECDGHEVAQFLITAGADLNAQDLVYGLTPLMWAAENNSKEVAKLLIAVGADLDMQSNYGKIAEQHARTDEMKLIFQGAKKAKEEQIFWREDPGCSIS